MSNKCCNYIATSDVLHYCNFPPGTWSDIYRCFVALFKLKVYKNLLRSLYMTGDVFVGIITLSCYFRSHRAGSQPKTFNAKTVKPAPVRVNNTHTKSDKFISKVYDKGWEPAVSVTSFFLIIEVRAATRLSF